MRSRALKIRACGSASLIHHRIGALPHRLWFAGNRLWLVRTNPPDRRPAASAQPTFKTFAVSSPFGARESFMAIPPEGGTRYVSQYLRPLELAKSQPPIKGSFPAASSRPPDRDTKSFSGCPTLPSRISKRREAVQRRVSRTPFLSFCWGVAGLLGSPDASRLTSQVLQRRI